MPGVCVTVPEAVGQNPKGLIGRPGCQGQQVGTAFIEKITLVEPRVAPGDYHIGSGDKQAHLGIGNQCDGYR